MAINRISSYNTGYYDYQASINNIRLAQALSKNTKYIQSSSSNVSPVTGSLKDSIRFMKQYNSSMSDLMSAANALRNSNRSGIMNDFTVSSSDESVATAKEKFNLRDVKELSLDIAQLARAQSNVSDSVKSSDAASGDMNFTVGNRFGSIDVNVSAVNSDGSVKTNIQMIREAASQINAGSQNVRANVVEKDGAVSLELTGTHTGSNNGFYVKGNLGAVAGLDKIQTEAANSIYSVTADGKTQQYESGSNNVSVDFTRIDVQLKSVGKTTIKSDVDSKQVAEAVGNLVNAYNASLKLLNDNYERGTGVDRQLRNLVAGLGPEQSLEKLGITVNKDATLKFDESTLQKSLKENPSLTKDLISGTNGIANKAFNKAVTGMNVNSGSLVNHDIETAQNEVMTSPYHAFNLYSKSGAYTLNNYYALGMMVNYLI